MRRKQLWLLTPLIALLAIGVVYAAYTIINITGEVQVSEAITVSPTSFAVGLYPAESVVEVLTISNAGSEAIEVNFVALVTPPNPELSVSVPTKVTIPASGSELASITISASKSLEPGLFTVEVGVTR